MSSRASAYGRAAVSGVLLALSFPQFGHPAVAWIAVTPLLIAIAGAPSLLRGFLLGLVTGVFYFAGTLYWITHVMASYGDMAGWIAVSINGLLIAYQALYPAFFALVMRRLLWSYGSRALLAAPLVWVATELGRTHLLSGFPWVLLGYSQVTVLPIAQLASVFGVYGLSALVVSVSASFALMAETLRPASRLRVHTGSPITKAAPVAVAIGLVLAVAVWGSWRLRNNSLIAGAESMRIGMIQGNVTQEEKTDSARAPAIFQTYLRMTREAIADGARAVIWPESSAPFMFEEDQPAADQVRRLARETGATLLFGSDQIERGNGLPDKYYNSAFLVRPDGSTGAIYRKIHLVPFGEYVPARSIFFFAAPLVETVSDFAAGTQAVLLPLGDHLISTAICYEVVYPALVRQFVRGGSELLTTITNDAWFGRTSAPYQHFAQASMRAIEQGRYLVRSANTGVSGIVDPYGRVLMASRIYEPAVMVGEIRFITAATIYSRIGDVFAYACTMMVAGLLLATRRRVR
jgi:apolipoprotein N-acyltransferase